MWLITQSGSFHADDALAYAIISGISEYALNSVASRSISDLLPVPVNGRGFRAISGLLQGFVNFLYCALWFFGSHFFKARTPG